MLLSLKNISLNYGEKQLLNDVDINIDNHSKIGLIGLNGSGKSSLLKMIANYQDLESKYYFAKNNLSISYMHQDSYNFTTEDMLSYLAISNDQEFEAKKILNQFDLDYTTKISTLSGGQKKKLSLAKALVNNSDILLLDEPTNHLDIHMIEWLEKYLANKKQAMVIISHDRYFLDAVTNQITELEDGKLYHYPGNYEMYLTLKSEKIASEEASHSKRLVLLKKEQAWMQHGAKARSTKSKDRIERFKQLKEATKSISNQDLVLSSNTARLGKKIGELTNLEIGYDDKVLINDFSYTFKKGDRIGLIGLNGSGKTSLLNVLALQAAPLSGTLDYGSTVKLGYFSQKNDFNDEEVRVIDFILEIGNYLEYDNVKLSAGQLLERFLFTKELQQKKIRQLSGGQKRRLLLLEVLLANPNFLILDEPTNDLDLNTIQLLEDYLMSFQGVVLIVSHDRHFMDKVVDNLWLIKNNEIIFSHEDLTIPQPEKKTVKKESVKFNKVKKLRFNYQEQKDFESIDDDINKLEIEIKEVNELINNTTDYDLMNELVLKRDELENKLSIKNDRWLELHEKKEMIDNQ